MASLRALTPITVTNGIRVVAGFSEVTCGIHYQSKYSYFNSTNCENSIMPLKKGFFKSHAVKLFLFSELFDCNIKVFIQNIF